MNAINFSCQGESHIATGKVCQDYSYSKVYENGNTIAIVCDGHGGKRYFRSDIGAKIAAEVTEQKVTAFIETVGTTLLSGTKLTERAAISTQIDNREFDKQSPTERAFRQLFGSIIYEWNILVAEHAKATPISEEEKSGLEERWITEFEKGDSLEKVYGCTLIVYASTPAFWFAFQIGDGKCFAVDQNGNWSEPIPWDERCFLNKTTSICDSGAIDEFRYCYEGDGGFPMAIILGSDGIDDSFGAEENQENFYVQILKSLVKEGLEATITEIETTLPQLSKIGSQDDMSIAMVYNQSQIDEAYPRLIEWQICNVKRQIADENEKIAKANKIQQTLDSVEHPTRQNIIDLQYANADEKRAIESRSKLQGRLDTLLVELNGNAKEEISEKDEVCDSEEVAKNENIAPVTEDSDEDLSTDTSEEQPAE